MTRAVSPAPERKAGPLRGTVKPLHWIGGGWLLVLLGAWTLHLLPQWLRNPDLSHGLFTPLVFIILLHEARARGTARYLPTSKIWTAVIGLIGATGLFLLAGAGLYAAALEWNHSLVEFLLAGALCALLTAAWLTAALDRVRLLPFNWPAAMSILVWALSAPIPPGTYTRLTQQLQITVTGGVLFSLNLIGVAASQDGNVIDLAHTSVGVEEACSGVRSLLSCVFAAFFLSAVISRRPAKRAILILLAGPLAIGMNFFRSLLLTLLANDGIDIRGRWHDLTGFGILAVTAALLAGLAVWMERSGRGPAGSTQREKAEESSPLTPPPVAGIQPDPSLPASRSSSSGNGTTSAERLVAGTLALSLATLVFFVVHTQPTHHRKEPAPDLWALLPASPPGWEVSTRTDLYRFSSQLQTDILAERTYTRTEPRGTFQVTVYLAYWPAGQASVSLVAAHTPDACWPGSGWVEDPTQHRSISLAVGGVNLPEAQFRSFKLDTFPQNVWYWHLFDGKPIEGKVGSPRELLSLAWHYGFRDEEEQVFIRVSSNRGWQEIAKEPLLAEIVARCRSLGLAARNERAVPSDK